MQSRRILCLINFLCVCHLGLWAQNIHINKYEGKPQSITRIRVASVSIIPDKWEKNSNWLRIEKMVRRAAVEGGAQVVVTPEGALDGYVINEVNRDVKTDKSLLDRFLQLGEPIDGHYIRKASTLANELNIYLIMGFLERQDQLLYNTAILIDCDGDIIGKYRKTHFAQGYKVNPEFYKAGEAYPVFQTPFGKVGILICYDRQLPEPARILALKGAAILFIPSYGSYSNWDGWNTVLLRTRAYENRLPLVFCHPYQSLLINSSGDVKVLGNGGDIAYYDVLTSREKNKKPFRNRRPGTYGKLVEVEEVAK